MIVYVEKGIGLHDAIRAAGGWLMQFDGMWLSSDDTEVQSIISSYDPLPKAQAAKWEEIKLERDRRQAGGIRVGDKLYHSDEKSRIQQLGLLMMGANIPANLKWKTLDGTFVNMTPQLAGQIFAAAAASDQAIFAAAEAHRAAMMQSNSPETYDSSSSWPEV